MKKALLVATLLIILTSGTAVASTLSIGQENYNARISRFNPRSFDGSDVTLISVGYGQDRYSGFAADLFSADDASGIEVEYQFIPQSLQGREQNFNYAAKIGAVSGDIWEEDSSGLKAGVVIEKKFDFDRQVYFEADIINSSAFVIDSELGFYGRFSEGVWGILSYKIATHEDYETVEGFNYGLRIDF